MRNSDQADEFASEIASSPVLKQIEVLDLSLGVLTDAGAEALLASPATKKLKRLDLHHNRTCAVAEDPASRGVPHPGGPG